jgi:exopolyphosphatase/guanosine-5'-triphosphate,3'-diphosphate pyrophosphatase
MGAIRPRWEWRTFGDDLDGVLPDEPERVEESDEVYLLSRNNDASAKIRGGRLDVKQLLEVRDDGLERWTPAMKADFPVAAADVELALSILNVAPSEPLRRNYTHRELLGELVPTTPGLVAVSLHKRRGRHSILGCMAESTAMWSARRATHTIAIEAEDPGLVEATVARLGLAERPVTCMAKGLKALAGYGPRFAVIDIGTNSVKFHLAERPGDGSWRTVADRAEVTRLGEGLERDRRISGEAMRRTADAIAGMSAEARRHGAHTVAAVGTAGLRAAVNADEFLALVRRRSGVEIEVISGDDEARLAYAAAIDDLGAPDGRIVVFDTGGGSSQFTLGEGGRIDERFSVEVGAVTLTARFGLDAAVPEERVEQARRAITAGLDALRSRPAPDATIGMGGAVTNLAAVRHGLAEYDPEVIHGAVLDRDELRRQIELYRMRGAEARAAITGLQPGRAPVILAGALIVDTILDVLAARALTVSDRGLRHGVLAERFGRPHASPPRTPMPAG